MNKQLPVLGTGLSGLVGSRLVELFSHRFHFVNLDLSTGVDITDRQKVLKIFEKTPAEAVVHFAAFTDVSRAYQERGNKNGLVYRVNVLGTRNIAQAAARFQKYLIHISTDFVFNGQKKTAYTEEDQRSPIEWYGQTKAWAEEEVEKSGASYLILRIAFPFRAHFPQKLDLVRKIIQRIKEKNLPPQFTDTIITPTFIDEIAYAVALCLEKKPQGILHCVGSTSLSPYQLAIKVAEVFDLDKTQVKPGSFKEYLKIDPRPRQQYLKLSNAKLTKTLGLPMSPIDQALRKCRRQMAQLGLL